MSQLQKSNCRTRPAEHEGIILNQKTITACGSHQQLPLSVHTYYPLHFNIDRWYKTALPSVSDFQALKSTADSGTTLFTRLF